ncbi:MAG TPA: SDR family oxidoreductase [Candidatus Acidoferrum sp.]|nr:SDR family oxidoreductase [Candidatus Acidoferrum sp.]
MDLGIAGKRALVLGASRGLGRAIATALAAEGAKVVLAARNRERLAEVAAALKGQSEPVDLGDPGSIERLAQAVLAAGGVDILINNTGGPPTGSILQIEGEAWRSWYQAMAISIFELTRQLLPPMQDKRWGRIVTVVSSGVEQPIANLGQSNAIRASIAGWAKSLANEVAAQGITVNCVVPGRIQTERVGEIDAANAKRQGVDVATVAAQSRATIPLGRYGTPEEFAAVVAFLASAPAAYVTGSLVRVDGGLIKSV